MFPLDYVKLQEVVSLLLLSASTAFCDKPDSPLFFLPIVSRVLEERLYLRYVEVFRFINKCGRDSGLGWSPIFCLYPKRNSEVRIYAPRLFLTR